MNADKKSLVGTRKRVVKMNRRYSRQQIARLKADRMVFKPTAPIVCGSKKWSIDSPGYCKICKESFSFLTTIHAEKHGFDSREAMLEAGAIKFNIAKKQKWETGEHAR